MLEILFIIEKKNFAWETTVFLLLLASFNDSHPLVCPRSQFIYLTGSLSWVREKSG